MWFNWSDFCRFDLVVQLNNISSINGHYYNRIKHLFLMYCYTGGQVSLSLSMNKNYSCYIRRHRLCNSSAKTLLTLTIPLAMWAMVVMTEINSIHVLT